MTSSLPSSMKAIQFHSAAGGLDKNLELNTNAPLPRHAKSLPPGSTLVKVAYSSLNPIDYKWPESTLFAPFVSKPAIPGLAFAGSVVESKLAHLAPGQLVFGSTELPRFGALAEYLVVGKENIAPLPNGVKLDEAAAVGVVGLTAYQAIAPFVKPGDKVLINGGSGGVGTFAVQIAKALGTTVTATCSGANVGLVKSLGVDEVIDYRMNNVIEVLRRSGKQFDAIVDNVFADPNLYWQSHHYLKTTGNYLAVAADLNWTFARQVFTIKLWPGWTGGGKRPFKMVPVVINAAEYEKLGGWLSEGKIKSVIEQTLVLEDVAGGYERLKSGRVRGKIVVRIV